MQELQLFHFNQIPVHQRTSEYKDSQFEQKRQTKIAI